jgi:hypothetical protein
MSNPQNLQGLHYWDGERRISDADAETIADRMSDKLIARLSDKATVNGLISVWSDQFDQRIGRSFRRGFWVLLTAIAFAIAVRFESILTWLKR